MKLILILLFVLIPILVSASTVSDFIVNPQPTYDVPPSTTNLLILDLTLPGTGLKSIKIDNAGTVAQINISRLSIYQDGASPGWDGDESEMVRKSFSPFFGAELNGTFSSRRIFVTVDISSTTYSGKTIKPEIKVNSAVFSSSTFTGPTDTQVKGFERKIVAGTGTPSVPLPPIAQKGEAISTSTIRWYFMDLSNNEFGFKILDENLKIAASGSENLSYLDETGLEPNTEYSNRKIVAFNDRGQSSVSTLSVFPTVRTLPLPIIEEVRPPDLTSEVTATSTSEVDGEVGPPETGGPFSPDELRAQIQEIQLKIIELLTQLIKLLQEQITKAQASLFWAFESFTDWLESRF